LKNGIEQVQMGCAVSWGAARSEFLLVTVLVAGCVQAAPVAQWRQPGSRPQIVTNERAYVEAPPPAKFLEPPLPAVKPDDGTVPRDAPKVDAVPSQRVPDGTTAGTVEPIRIGTSSPMKPLQLIGLTEAGTTKLLGQPAEAVVSPQSRIWTYRSAACTLRVFFYSIAAAPDFRALTYQIEDRNPADPDHSACLAGIIKSSVS
jgi:hypothetical protein